METEYYNDAYGKYLVLRIRESGMKKMIRVDEVAKWAYDHDYLISDDDRCWDCGMTKPLRHPPTNWALPKVAD